MVTVNGNFLLEASGVGLHYDSDKGRLGCFQRPNGEREDVGYVPEGYSVTCQQLKQGYVSWAEDTCISLESSSHGKGMIDGSKHSRAIRDVCYCNLEIDFV